MNRLYLAGGVVIAFVLAIASAVHERRARIRAEQGVAHQARIYAEHDVYHTDTLFQRDTVRYREAVTNYRTLRDTLRVTDTLAVREGFRRADSALARCDSLLRTASTTIRARDTLVVRVKDELAIAQHGSSRLSARAIALYDPLAGIPAASLEATVRLSGRLSVLVRGDQRFAPSERPRGYLGIAVAF